MQVTSFWMTRIWGVYICSIHNSRTVSQNVRTLAELQVARRAILQGHSSRHVSTIFETPFSQQDLYFVIIC